MALRILGVGAAVTGYIACFNYESDDKWAGAISSSTLAIFLIADAIATGSSNMLAGRQKDILATRDRKLEEARVQRALPRQKPSIRFKGTMIAAEADNAGVISTTGGPSQR